MVDKGYLLTKKETVTITVTLPLVNNDTVNAQSGTVSLKNVGAEFLGWEVLGFETPSVTSASVSLAAGATGTADVVLTLTAPASWEGHPSTIIERLKALSDGSSFYAEIDEWKGFSKLLKFLKDLRANPSTYLDSDNTNIGIDTNGSVSIKFEVKQLQISDTEMQTLESYV